MCEMCNTLPVVTLLAAKMWEMENMVEVFCVLIRLEDALATCDTSGLMLDS